MTETKEAKLYPSIGEQIQREECMLCTVLEGAFRGEKMLFSGGKRIWQSVSGGLLATVEGQLLEMPGSGIFEIKDTRIFCERFTGRSRLVICGAGHVSIPVIEMGKKLGFHVTVLEDRPLFADRARRAGADQVLCDCFEHGMEQISGGNGTYFVIVTRGHRYDQYCLEQALKKPHTYIGMMGSRKRVALVKETLSGRGVAKALLEQVHTPIGLPIGAETPEEIAVSILAEIIQVKNSKKCTAGYAGEILDALLEGEKRQEPSVLAVIVSRKGSAPRKIGTKMLIYRDGRTIGTIGGGCMENQVMEQARRMLEGIRPSPKLIRLDMTGEDGADEGMVCGGTVEVYLERSFS